MEHRETRAPGERVIEGLAPEEMPPPPGWHEQLTHIGGYHEAVEVVKHPDLEAINSGKPTAGGTVVALRGDEHKHHRRLLTPLFRKSVLEHYEQTVLLPYLDDRLARLADAPPADGLDAMQLLGLANIMVTAAFVGLDGIDDDESAAWLRDCAMVWAETVNSMWTLDVDEQRRAVEAGLRLRDEFAERIYSPSVARRREAPDARDDVLSMLLREYDGVWPEDRLLREVVMWVNAAPNNTTKTTAAAIVELERWFDADESRRELAGDLGFLIKVVNETSRLYPSQPAILREAVRDGELPSTGRRFVAGEWFFVDSRAANRDESVYGADANEFNPFREIGPGIQSQGIAFGGGKHVCLGRPMVTANPSSYERNTATPGAIVKTFRTLYSYGMRLDPEREPEVNRRNMRGNFSAVWVTLDRARGEDSRRSPVDDGGGSLGAHP